MVEDTSKQKSPARTDKSEKTLRITQVRSVIGRTQDQRDTVRSLGLKRIRHTVEQPDRPEIRGMLRKVPHLVTFEEVEGA